MTEPEKININELKRLLVEVISEILETANLAMSHEDKVRQRKRLMRTIERATLNGDDS